MRVTKIKEERKSELITIAEKLFGEMGYDQVKVSDIMKEAKVAQGTFYYHFKSKEDVLYAVLEKTITGMALQLKALPPTNKFQQSKDLNASWAIYLHH